MRKTDMRKAIFNHTAMLLEQYPVDHFLVSMGHQWETLPESEQRRWAQAFSSVVRSMKISGRDESIYK